MYCTVGLVDNRGVTDLIPVRDYLWKAVECSCCGWSALWLWVWDLAFFVTLLAEWVTCAELRYFHKIQNTMLILSQDTQDWIAQESLLRQIFLSRILFLSFSRSALALFQLCMSLSLSVCSSDSPSTVVKQLYGSGVPSEPANNA